MTRNKSATKLLVGSAIAFIVGWALTSVEFIISLGLCLSQTDTSCVSRIIEGVGQPIFMGSITVIILAIILLFSRQEAFTSWKKFAIWAIPLGAILIALTPVSDGGAGGIGIPNIDREIVTWIVSLAFLLISIVIILHKSFNGRTVQ